MNNLLDDEQLRDAGPVLASWMREIMQRAAADPIIQSALVYSNINGLHRFAKEIAPFDKELRDSAKKAKHALQNIVDRVEDQECLPLS